MEEVRVWEEEVHIPTYEPAKPNKNPMFLEKRVYQGSSGKVYPYPTIERISTKKKDKIWHAVYLENEYLKIMILPELGGRIQRAYDKTNGYDFVYYNHVIKPALVGLTGPWISGGIEFNWPQHHRPTTFLPVDHLIRKNEDGSCTVLVNDVDRMYGTKAVTSFTLYPGKAYLEVKGQLYNRTSMPQTFLWWANPAVSVNDHTQSVFPPDVHWVMDHGKRDVSKFPIADGIYYKHDYSKGVDISRYKNIPVPTSYMAEKSEYDFIGGYDYKKEAGLLHVADHHISPGKKQWTWGCGEFGKAWDKNLTDEDGPYIELMTGVYTENQPDFSWLKPFEEKTFKQYFMPYKKVGRVKNATIHAALSVEVKKEEIVVIAYATQEYQDAVITVTEKGRELFREHTKISPVQTYEAVIPAENKKAEDICVSIAANGRMLVSYQEKKSEREKDAEPAKPAKEPEEIKTNEELLLTGLHIEQHRHATYSPDRYYLEGLRRDPGDIRLNNAYGMLLLRRGNLKEAEGYFKKAVKRLTWRSPNPYDSEAYYNLGLCCFYQKKRNEAYEAFYKASWTNEQQEMSYYYLAVIETTRGNYEQALEFTEKGICKNLHNIKARGLKAVLLRKLKRKEEAVSWTRENLRVDPFDYVSRYEQALLLHMDEEMMKTMNGLMRGFEGNYLQAARDYMEAGCYQEAEGVLLQCKKESPLLSYYRGYSLIKMGREREGEQEYRVAEACSPDYCFPNKLEDIAVLEDAIARNKDGAKAYYYLGNLYYDKLQFQKAIDLWEKSVALDNGFPTVHRNLALAYFNKEKDIKKAERELEAAFSLDETDSRVFMELDQLRKRIGTDVQKRMRTYEGHMELVKERDDAMLELVTLYNLLGKPEKAYETLMSHTFRPWEGGEGKVPVQYKISLLQMAKREMEKEEYEKAEGMLAQALIYPENLGEGRLEGTKDNHIHYYLGLVKEALDKKEEARECFLKATLGADEPAGVMYYYDQPADMILYKGLASQKLGRDEAAATCFHKLMEYGKTHVNDVVKEDFFAVSLPDFMIFEEDMDKKNQAHCHYLMGLSYLGEGKLSEAAAEFEQALQIDYNHQNCRIYLQMAEKKDRREAACISH